ncbi:C40 family peptidase [Fulvivirga sediminis]|uniref:C40 family peptidase n=1 Tax=Fulvivirga sediminis TaxID=2803949 RepID=A0A937F749_9BACT|nr:C40 family peptidase [Fulvivirga sediminis]MBL3656251.1 C40 family peptidase [Fulvivirga sediminis]
MQQNRIVIWLALIIFLSSCASARKAKVRQDKIQTVIKTAKSFIGTPYKWGGTTRGGMDCSGLLYNSYSSIGFNMPRTSAMQSELGKKVGKNKIEEGDLVFFATGKKRRKITHVGLVTYSRRGTVRFIHSSSSLGVVESNLETKYYKKRFITARRPF